MKEGRGCHFLNPGKSERSGLQAYVTPHLCQGRCGSGKGVAYLEGPQEVSEVSAGSSFLVHVGRAARGYGQDGQFTLRRTQHTLWWDPRGQGSKGHCDSSPEVSNDREGKPEASSPAPFPDGKTHIPISVQPNCR